MAQQDQRGNRYRLITAFGGGDVMEQVRLLPAGPQAPVWVHAAAARVGQLTPQQTRVLRYLAAGMDSPTIRKALGCSERTVKLHVSGVLQRLGVNSRTQAALVGYHLVITGELVESE
jgi:DNA-binding NarL/FixJ family response regulator